MRNLQTYAAVYGMKWMGSVTTLDKSPGDAAQDKRLAWRLSRLAKKLVSD